MFSIFSGISVSLLLSLLCVPSLGISAVATKDSVMVDMMFIVKFSQLFVHVGILHHRIFLDAIPMYNDMP